MRVGQLTFSGYRSSMIHDYSQYRHQRTHLFSCHVSTDPCRSRCRRYGCSSRSQAHPSRVDRPHEPGRTLQRHTVPRSRGRDGGRISRRHRIPCTLGTQYPAPKRGVFIRAEVPRGARARRSCKERRIRGLQRCKSRNCQAHCGSVCRYTDQVLGCWHHRWSPAAGVRSCFYASTDPQNVHVLDEFAKLKEYGLNVSPHSVLFVEGRIRG